MMFKTHLAFGALAALFAIQYLNPRNQLLFFLVVVFASSLPDIDSPESKIGSKVKVIGWLFEHRGFFHSFIALGLFSLLFFLATKNELYSAAFFAGYASHIVIDAFTIEGIAPLHPVLKTRLKGFIRTGHFLEFIVFIGLVVFAVIKLVGM
ncbi:hypothetical protein COV19_06560 [Candidatus Woesearchaeota archaeon CG10_big_fil_rev_8_21_14_0_10_44_13]|nr:MAG: hypothetical protein COV19_06560 [Candidatus Woesearchaeota archaeon CG10_big_fil_rev_8_21_14_0_10_44_13]